MKDKDFAYLAGACVTLIVLYFAWHHAHQIPPANPAQASGSLPQPWLGPMTGVYEANPNAFQPASLGDLTVKVGNQMGNYLTNQYIPLFGFVGEAQGQLYQ